MQPTSTSFRNLIQSYLMQRNKGHDPLLSNKRFQSDAIQRKVALVTGGAHGIGFNIAEKLLDAGARAVSLLGRNEEKGANACACLEEKYGPNRVTYIRCDASKKEEMEGAFEKTVCEFCGLDIVVNNAGMLKDQTWEAEIDLNNKALVRGSLLAVKHMGKNNGGNGGIVINVASILGLQGLTGCPVYVGTKHFIIGFDRSMGTPFYFDLTGIKFMTICPGVTDTPMVSDASKFVFQEFPGLAEVVANDLGALVPQAPENVGVGTVEMICQGKNGSIWVSEGEENFEVEIPPRETFRVNC